MARRRRHKRGFGRFLKKLGKGLKSVAKVAMPFAGPALKMVAGIVPGGGTVVTALETAGKFGAFKALGGAFKKGGLKRLAGFAIPGLSQTLALAKQGGRLMQGKRVQFGKVAGALAPGLNETMALARQGRNLVQGRRVDFGQVAGALSGVPGGISSIRAAGEMVRRAGRAPLVGRRGGRDGSAWAALGNLADVAGLDDGVASRILGMRLHDYQRAKVLAKKRRDAGALEGVDYVVESGDYLSKIAGAVIGNAGRWRELRDANPQKPVDPKTGNFKTLYAGERLHLPASWIAELGLTSSAPASTPGTVTIPETTIYGDVAPAAVPVSMPPDFTLPSAPAAIPISLPPTPTGLPTLPEDLPDVVTTTGTEVPSPVALPPIPSLPAAPPAVTVEPAAAPPPEAAPTSAATGIGTVLGLGAIGWALGML